jgi:hypothetical protein
MRSLERNGTVAAGPVWGADFKWFGSSMVL